MLSICDICRSFAFKLATMKSLSHLHINLRYLTSVNFQLNSFFYHQTSSKPHIFSLTHPFAALPAASSSLLMEARLAVMCLCVFVCNSPCVKMVLLPTFHCLSFHDSFFKPTPRYMFFPQLFVRYCSTTLSNGSPTPVFVLHQIVICHCFPEKNNFVWLRCCKFHDWVGDRCAVTLRHFPGEHVKITLLLVALCHSGLSTSISCFLPLLPSMTSHFLCLFLTFFLVKRTFYM